MMKAEASPPIMALAFGAMCLEDYGRDDHPVAARYAFILGQRLPQTPFLDFQIAGFSS